MPYFRILSMDGGNGLNTAELLMFVQEMLPTEAQQDFLNQVDLFVGVSAGAINSLFFANHDNPTDALAKLRSFWQQIGIDLLEGLRPEHIAANIQGGKPPDQLICDILLSAFGLGLTVAGVKPLLYNDAYKKLLIEEFGEDTTLGDLNHEVAILSFQLDGSIDLPLTGDQQMPFRSWKPKIFTNLKLDGVDEPDLNEKVVDVALRSSAFPIELPVYQSISGDGGPGYADGGVVANNPAMCALAQVLGHKNKHPGRAIPSLPALCYADLNLDEHILMFSVGTGRNLVGNAQFFAPHFINGSAPLGYIPWLLDPLNPLLLIDVLLQASSMGVDFQVQQLLGDHVHRLNPPLQFAMVRDDEVTQGFLQNAVAWLETSAWLSGA